MKRIKKEEEMLDDWQRKKVMRIQYLMQELQKHETVEKEWLMSSLSVYKGWHEDTTQKYLDDLEELGIIETDEKGKIRYHGIPKKEKV